MEPIVLYDIPFRIELDALFRHLRLPSGTDEAADVTRLCGEAESIGRPKALYGLAFVEHKTESTVTVDGVTFNSRVLSVNLDPVHRVFPYIATCGRELEEWADGIADPLERFCAETIKQMVLGKAISAFGRHLDELFNPGATSTMNPGSLADWPLSEQRKLFQLCGDPQARIGVALSPSLLMVPTKSVSGIRFSSETLFENCQLCPRPSCPGRRVPYDAGMFDRRYRQVTATMEPQAAADEVACSECGATLTTDTPEL